MTQERMRRSTDHVPRGTRSVDRRHGYTPVSFTQTVRAELAHVPVGDRCCRLAETAGMLRLGGSMTVHGGPPADGGGLGWVVELSDGAAARRVHAALSGLFGQRPDIEVHRPGGLRAATTYRVQIAAHDEGMLRALGILDPAGRPTATPPAATVRRRCDAIAYVRGALLAAGSISDPRRDPHLEIRGNNEPAAATLVALLTRLGVPARAAARVDGWRVVVKSGAAIGELLTLVGAYSAFLHLDQARLRRQLRAEANRVANADRANVGRSVAASARQVQAVSAALAVLDDAELDDLLREVALVRLANPEASLVELGALLERPVGKATVHRRLARLVALATARQGPPHAAG